MRDKVEVLNVFDKLKDELTKEFASLGLQFINVPESFEKREQVRFILSGNEGIEVHLVYSLAKDELNTIVLSKNANRSFFVFEYLEDKKSELPFDFKKGKDEPVEGFLSRHLSEVAQVLGTKLEPIISGKLWDEPSKEYMDKKIMWRYK